jgi:hypothetical protein
MTPKPACKAPLLDHLVGAKKDAAGFVGPIALLIISSNFVET